MDLSERSQPSVNDAYNVLGNPIDQNLAEQRHAQSGDTANSSELVESREQGDIPLPSTHGGGGQPSSLGYGSRTGEGDDTSGTVSTSLPL